MADEYQAKAVLDLCVKCLKDERKTKENVVEILYLSSHTVIAREDGRLEGVREECYHLIKNMEFNEFHFLNTFNTVFLYCCVIYFDTRAISRVEYCTCN